MEQRLEVIDSGLRVFWNDIAGIEIDVGEIRVTVNELHYGFADTATIST